MQGNLASKVICTRYSITCDGRYDFDIHYMQLGCGFLGVLIEHARSTLVLLYSLDYRIVSHRFTYIIEMNKFVSSTAMQRTYENGIDSRFSLGVLAPRTLGTTISLTPNPSRVQLSLHQTSTLRPSFPVFTIGIRHSRTSGQNYGPGAKSLSKNF